MGKRLSCRRTSILRRRKSFFSQPSLPTLRSRCTNHTHKGFLYPQVSRLVKSPNCLTWIFTVDVPRSHECEFVSYLVNLIFWFFFLFLNAWSTALCSVRLCCRVGSIFECNRNGSWIHCNKATRIELLSDAFSCWSGGILNFDWFSFVSLNCVVLRETRAVLCFLYGGHLVERSRHLDHVHHHCL